MAALLERFQANVGDIIFLPVMGIVALLLSLKLIPLVTDMMVNAAAGLAGKHLGREYRTLVINCSTNNPEVATMFVSLFFVAGLKPHERMAGIGTPLGSNFANIYLIFGFALAWVIGRLWLSNRTSLRQLFDMIKRERKLFAWHLIVSFGMFLLAFTAFQLITPTDETGTIAPSKTNIFIAGFLCFAGVAIYLKRESALRQKRPELFENIDEAGHIACWKTFIVGTTGLIVCCYFLNVMFLVATNLYSPVLSRFLGPAVFAMMHYLLGALVTSLPEMNVAVSNYERAESADLNTALSSASASNMSNLAIAGIGCVFALFV